MYGKLVNENLIYAPDDFLTEDGKFIFGFNSNKKALKENGFKEIIDVAPEYNIETQLLKKSGYLEDKDSIQVLYTVEYKPMTREEQLNIERNIAIKLIVDTLPDYKARLVPLLFDSWSEGKSYSKGDRVEYNRKLYKVRVDIDNSLDKPDISGDYKLL